MKHPKIPKHIREIYNPSKREWMRWLRFRRKAIAAAEKGHEAFMEYFRSCEKSKCQKSSIASHGMYPGSGSFNSHLEMFEWAWFSMRICFQGVSVDLSIETRDSGTTSIAYTNDF